MKDLDERSTVLTLCGSQNNENCPTVTITKSAVYINDDFGGQVRITREQFALLLEQANALKGE